MLRFARAGAKRCIVGGASPDHVEVRLSRAHPGAAASRVQQGSGVGEAVIGRSRFLKHAVMLGGAFVGSELVLVGIPRLTNSAPSQAQDKKIFAFMLFLEQLQTAFYSKVLSSHSLNGELLQFAQLVGAQEQAHLAYIEKELAGSDVRAPHFHFGASTTSAHGFLAAAVGIEEVGLGAYNGQAPNLTPEALRRAGRIISVEARHVAWARSLADELPAPVASDVPLTQAEVQSRVKRSGYVG